MSLTGPEVPLLELVMDQGEGNQGFVVKNAAAVPWLWIGDKTSQNSACWFSCANMWGINADYNSAAIMQ